MPKNYYIILGIPSDSSQSEIKSAYRRLAKEFHPDYYGQSTPFLTIQEAYSVLSDPIRRRSYDDAVQEKRRLRNRAPVVEDYRTPSRHVEVEPLIPDDRPARSDEASLLRSFHSYGPSLESLTERWLRNFRETNHPKGERLENLTVVIQLSPEQAFHGGHVRLNVPVRLSCSGCNGRGAVGPYECWRCSGQGILSGEYPVIISYPAGITDNHSMQLSLERYGIRNLYLTVQFRISETG